MPIDVSRYPKDWAVRSRFVRFYRAKNHCEWCGAENYKPHPITGSKVVLTTAHVYDKRPEMASLLNLAALCQRCHIRHDAKDKAEARARKRREREAQGDLFAPPETLREFIKRRVRDHIRTPQHEIARRMGISASSFSRKLNQYETDTHRFTLDDLERFIEVTKDLSPIYYLVEKYIAEGSSELAYLERRIAEIKGQKAQKASA